MLALGDLLTEVERRAQVVHVVLNNGGLEFVKILTGRLDDVIETAGHNLGLL